MRTCCVGVRKADNEMKKRQIASRVPRRAKLVPPPFPGCLFFTDGAKQEGAKRFAAADRKKKDTHGGIAPSAANDAAARSLANVSIFPRLARPKSRRTCHNMNIKRAVTHPPAHSFASIRRDWRKPPGAGNRWRLVLHRLPKTKKKAQNKKKENEAAQEALWALQRHACIAV